MELSKRSIWWLVSIAILFFSLSNTAGIFALEVLSIHQKVMLSLIVLFYFAFHWLAVIVVSVKLQKRYPEARQDRLRLSKTYAYSSLIIISTMIIMDGIQNLFLDKPFGLSLGENLFNLFQGLGISILLVSLTEAFYQYYKNQRSERENAELNRLNLLAQYNNLKQQVNPHFLFNSLNTLSALINSDPGRAETFIEELSLVYRYLLQNSQDELVELNKELHFLNSYIHLIKTRFGTGLNIQIEVDPIWHYYLVPPLSLQLLVENAVKHNELSPDRPLLLRIRAAADQRINIWNNLQPKRIALPSEKVGLVNIMTKYRLLGQPEVIVLKTSTSFSVSLPLIKNR